MSVSRKARVCSEETRSKMSIVRKGMTHSEETRKKMCIARADRVFTEESRKKMSISQSGVNSHRARKVICITTGIVFKTMREAEKYYNINQNAVSHCCTGKQKSAGKDLLTGEKLHWMYHDEYLKLNQLA